MSFLKKSKHDKAMSRPNPTLPPGLPPKPMDSYRPGAGPNSSRDTRRDPPMYHFGGSRPRSPPRYNNAPGYDRFQGSPPSYGSSGGGYAPGTGPAHNDRRPYQSDTYSPNNGGYGRRTDVYRPQEGNFTFRSEAPPSIDFRSTDSRRPRSPPRQRNQANSSYRGSSNINRQGQSGQRGGYRGRGGPRLASERDFLKGNRAPTPELMPGMEEDDHGIRYKALEDLSDSEEAEMDMSDNEGDDGEPRKKQARIGDSAPDGNNSPKFAPAPKWSNPDPYTVLPPVDGSSRKKKDVVKLIRKARVDAVPGSIAKANGDTDDFISFNFGDETEAEDNAVDTKAQGVGVVGAPTGPRTLSHPHPLPQTPDSHGTRKRSFPIDLADVVDLTFETRSNPPPNKMMPIKPSVPKPPQHKTIILPNKPATSDFTTDPSLGSRKRNFRDEIKQTPTLREAFSLGAKVKKEPGVSKSTKGVPRPVNGIMVRDWQPIHGISSTPWITIDHSDTTNMGLW